MQTFWSIVGVVVAIILVLFIIVTTAFKQPTFDFYTRRLDHWVQAGGDVATLQTDVVENCGKLTLTQAGPLGAISLIAFERDEFDFRVDVCTKMTVNRVHKQTEFENREIVTTICDGDVDLFRRLCVRSGLTP
jgi:hypothetical protein